MLTARHAGMFDIEPDQSARWAELVGKVKEVYEKSDLTRALGWFEMNFQTRRKAKMQSYFSAWPSGHFLTRKEISENVTKRNRCLCKVDHNNKRPSVKMAFCYYAPAMIIAIFYLACINNFFVIVD